MKALFLCARLRVVPDDQTKFRRGEGLHFLYPDHDTNNIWLLSEWRSHGRPPVKGRPSWDEFSKTLPKASKKRAKKVG